MARGPPCVVKNYSKVNPHVAERGRRLQQLFKARTGRELVLTSAYRSPDKQEELYELYRAGRGLPANPPGQSSHEFGLGLDFSAGRPWPQDRRYWEEFWRLARSVGFNVIGPRDPVHVEAPGWRRVRDQMQAGLRERLRRLYQRDPGGNVEL